MYIVILELKVSTRRTDGRTHSKRGTVHYAASKNRTTLANIYNIITRVRVDQIEQGVSAMSGQKPRGMWDVEKARPFPLSPELLVI